MKRKITDFQRLKAEIIINAHAEKAAKWTERLAMFSIPGAGMSVIEYQARTIADEFTELFALSGDEYLLLSQAATQIYDLLPKRVATLNLLTLLPDLGIFTSTVVEQIAESTVKNVGWATYLLIEEGLIGTRTLGSGKSEVFGPSRGDLRRMLDRAKHMW